MALAGWTEKTPDDKRPREGGREEGEGGKGGGRARERERDGAQALQASKAARWCETKIERERQGRRDCTLSFAYVLAPFRDAIVRLILQSASTGDRILGFVCRVQVRTLVWLDGRALRVDAAVFVEYPSTAHIKEAVGLSLLHFQPNTEGLKSDADS